MKRLVLIGNPNSGKTTLFNELTGNNQYVGNWPGVTVEKKEGYLKKHKEYMLVDLPGIYSLSPNSLEEVITRNYLLEEEIDCIINIIDASNLERNLYLTTQIIEMGIPTIVVLNLMDVVLKEGDFINMDRLSNQLGCPVVATAASKRMNVSHVALKAIEVSNNKATAKIRKIMSSDTEKAIDAVEDVLSPYVKQSIRWFAIKVLEKDQKVLDLLMLPVEVIEKVNKIIEKLEVDSEDDGISIISSDRYSYITKVIATSFKKKNPEKVSNSQKIDKVLTHKWLGLPLFFLVMWGIYFISIQTVGGLTVELLEWFFADFIGANLEQFLASIHVVEWLSLLITEGIIGGVGAVLSFVPQIMILFLLISILEDSGYMARVAFIMDRIFRRFGLSGKSFIPMIIGTGCTVPALMSSRTIEQQRDRRMTIILTPFIPCSAKLPVFALFIGALFPTQAWVGPSMYFIGFIVVILSGIILKKLKIFKGEVEPFLMELPKYHVPSIRNTLVQMWDRGKEFIIKAGTIIFVASALIWLLQSFDWSFRLVLDNPESSILGTLGLFFAPIFSPLGFGNWESTVAVLTSFAAKENVISTFGIIFSSQNSSLSLTQSIQSIFTPLSAFSFMIFILLASPCFASIATTKKEMNSGKWTVFAILFQTGIAYILATLVYQIGSLFL